MPNGPRDNSKPCTFFAMDHEQNFLPVEMVEGPPPERADR